MFKKWKQDKKNLHLSIVSAILWINLCSIIILTAFNYYVFHHKSGKAYLDSFISYNQQVTDLAFKNIDRQIIQPVLGLPQLYFSRIKENAPILLPQTQPIVDSSQNIMALATEMQKIQKSNPSIAGIDIYYEATGTVVTHFNRVHFPVSDEQRDKYIPWYKDYRNTEQTQGGIWTVGDVYLMDEPAIIQISRISRLDWGGKDIILSTYISPESFSEYIDTAGGNLLITTPDNQILYGRDTWGGLEIPDFPGTPGAQQIGDFMVFHDTSPTSGLNYYYAIDNSHFYKDYNRINNMFLFNFLLSIVFNIIMLMVISYYNHTAYRKRVHTLSREAGISIEKSSKSFDGSLNILAKEIHTLHEAVDSSRGLLLQNAVQSVLLNESAGTLDDKLIPYLTRKNCCVALISQPQADVETLPVEDLQEDYPPGREGYDVLFATVEKQNLAAVLIYDDGSWENVSKDFIRDMDVRWKDYRLVYGCIAPSGQEGIQHSYQCASEAARYQYILTDERHLYYEHLGIAQRKETGSHLKLFEAVRKDINSASLFDLKSHIEMLVISFKSGNYTIDYCQSTLRDLVTLLYQVIQQNQLDMWVVFGYDIRAYYKKIENIDSFHSWCDTICEMTLKNIHQKRQSVDEDMRLKILRLVDEHLENDITLDLLADKLQVRPDGASRLFRQVMGTGYTEYIKNRKLKRAEELMAQGCSVKDTAEKLGYSSAQYFIKVFKENYGVTPNQYKKSQDKEQD